MKKPAKEESAVPKITQKNLGYQKWVSRVYGFAAFCLGALALVEITDTATPFIQTLLMLGIVAAGTLAWVLQAKRECQNCGVPYGYHFRLVNANICHKCGAEFPKWRPGQRDKKTQKK